ncbi:MAG: DUF4806 domain-containing protein [Leptospira sp.]|nr:DUF4806 domain-containing protein [Leptospira sp.]
MEFIKNIIYPTFCAGLLGFFGYAQMGRIGGADVDEVENVPKTVRENPGVYRAHYINYMRYLGGK